MALLTSKHSRVRAGLLARRSELDRTLRASLAEGIVAEVVSACTGGAVLVTWALQLGGGPLFVALLGALPFFAQLVQIPAAWLSAGASRRTLAITATAVARWAYLPLAVLPLLPLDVGVARAVLIAVAAVSAVAGVIGNNAWLAWMSDVVPVEQRGRYFARRNSLGTLGGAAMSLAAGGLLDATGAAGPRPVLSVLALVAVAAGSLAAWLMAKQHESAPGRAEPPPSLAATVAPLRCRDARAFATYQIAWNAAAGLASGVVAMHMISNLRISCLAIAAYGAGIALVRTLAASVWGRAIDRVGARPVLVACSFAAAALPLVWLIPTPGHVRAALLLDVVLSGTFAGGQAMASFALPMSIAPRAGRTHHLAMHAAAAGVSFAAAATAGGAVAAALPRELVVGCARGYGLHVLFVVAAVARLGAAVLAGRVVEPGARSVRELLRALRDVVGSVASRYDRDHVPQAA